MDEEFSDIRGSTKVKEVFEALLVDSSTPEEVFMELFGMTIAQIDLYKEKYTGPWGRPRMFCYAYITDRMKGNAQKLALKVFNGGWSVLDALFNGGRNVNAADMAMKVLRIMAGRSGVEAVEGKNLSPKLIAAARGMVSAAQQYSQIEGAETDEAWDFMIKELSDKEKASKLPQSIVDAYNQVTQQLAANKIVKETDDENLV